MQTKRRPPSRQLRLQGFDFLPDVVRDRLVETHTYPLSCNWGHWDAIERLPADVAWPTRSEIQLHSDRAYSAITLDVDIEGAADRHYAAAGVGVHPLANFATIRPESDHAHVVWCLADPVLRKLGETPALAYYEGVTDQLRRLLSADHRYVNVLTHNPISPAYVTLWGADAPYELSDLHGWADPAYVDAALDEDSDLYRILPALFEPLMRWIGYRRNVEKDIEAVGLRLASKECPDTDPELVRTCIANVDSYRQMLIRRVERGGSWHTPQFIGRQRWRGRRTRPETRQRAGRRSGKSRRQSTAERDDRILRLSADGMSQRRIASAEGISRGVVVNVLRRAASAQNPALSAGFVEHVLGIDAVANVEHVLKRNTSVVDHEQPTQKGRSPLLGLGFWDSESGNPPPSEGLGGSGRERDGHNGR